jgi:hypothetical protein
LDSIIHQLINVKEKLSTPAPVIENRFTPTFYTPGNTMGEMTSDVEIPRPATPPKKPIISPEKHFNRHFSPSITHSGSRGKKNEILSHLVQVRDK